MSISEYGPVDYLELLGLEKAESQQISGDTATLKTLTLLCLVQYFIRPIFLYSGFNLVH